MKKIILSLLIMIGIANSSRAINLDVTNVNIQKKYCFNWSCCYVSYYGFSVGYNIASGTVCFESAGRYAQSKNGNRAGEVESIRVQIIPSRDKIQAGILNVKEDTRLSDENGELTMTIKKGEYEADDEGNANINVIFEQ